MNYSQGVSQEDILAKKAILEEARQTLKKDFVGLDKIIDEVIDNLLPWWLFPDTQLRPTVINLWGMTGTGKTALIKRLAEVLTYKDKLLVFDMGQFGDNNGSLKDSFTGRLEHFNRKPIMLVFDEFQFAKSLDEAGRENNNDNLRVIWDLLDAGQFYYESYMNSYYHRRVIKCVKILIECQSKGVVVEGGVIKEGLTTVSEKFKDFKLGWDSIEDKDRVIAEDYFQSDVFVNGLVDVSNEKIYDKFEAIGMVQKCNLDELIDYLVQIINAEESQKLMDLSKSVIFVIGNLDEAFYMSSVINPDINPDDFYKSTLKINITHIKSALQRRFRNEQIARLGNNHIIYPAFDTKTYLQLIWKHLDIAKKMIQERFGIAITFDKSIADIIFKEGVFPTQGARPVLTTIKNLIEGYVSRIVVTILENQMPATAIEWSYQEAKERFDVKFMDKDGQLIEERPYPVNLKVHSLRKSQNDDVQAHTAVHESGHAILAALVLRILPDYVVTRTVDSDTAGFCKLSMPEDVETKSLILKQIQVGLGGYLAEKIIFGKENTSTGVVSDIIKITEAANRAVKEFAMGDDPVRMHIHGENTPYFHYKANSEETALKLVKHCEAEAEAILLRNKKLLLKMSHYLTSHSRMDKKTIKRYMTLYATDNWVREEGFIEANKYFNFKAIVAKKLKDIEKKAMA
jgi:Peptidase family M41/C-terminal, D2-small domain, of ClpB protein